MSSKSQPILFEQAPGCTIVQTLNPAWKPGDGLASASSELAKKWKEDEDQGWKTFDPEMLERRRLYHLMISGVVPRPIGFVSSLSPSGVPNLAPFSGYNMVSSSLPMVMFSVSSTRGTAADKDTTDNIRQTKEFTVNIISEPWVEAANFCSVDAPTDISEWSLSGLTMQTSIVVKPAWVRESAFAMECELYQIIDIPSPSTDPLVHPKVTQSIILGLVKRIHVREAVLDPCGYIIDPVKFKPISRLGGNWYGGIGKMYEMPRPVWADWEEQLKDSEGKEERIEDTK